LVFISQTVFAYAENCFNVSVSKIPHKARYEVQVQFIMETLIKKLYLLLQIQSYFGSVGNIVKISKKNGLV